MIDGNWLSSHRADPRALALYKRHYSAKKNARWRAARSLNFVGPGQPMVLLTVGCDAVFVWVKNTGERWDKQAGIICTLFRNESPKLSSDLIREADDLAWQRWADPRHFTYVDPTEVRSSNPGYCFVMAGWSRCGSSAEGKLIFERLAS
jgi:hypothetical protein